MDSIVRAVSVLPALFAYTQHLTPACLFYQMTQKGEKRAKLGLPSVPVAGVLPAALDRRSTHSNGVLLFENTGNGKNPLRKMTPAVLANAEDEKIDEG